MATAVIASRALLCNNSFLAIKPFTLTSSFSRSQLSRPKPTLTQSMSTTAIPPLLRRRSCPLTCHAARRKPTFVDSSGLADEGDSKVRQLLQILLWAAEAVYILWLFLLPFAPGDPVWAISSETTKSLLDLSLNFFFILPAMNFGARFLIMLISQASKSHLQSLEYFLLYVVLIREYTVYPFVFFGNKLSGRTVGMRLIDAPILHPMSEGLFNFVIGWTFIFAPLLFTDQKRDRYKGSLDVLWGLQMFLTNTFLIPYMAIRLNEASEDSAARPQSQLGSLMTNGAPVVGMIGGAVCIISILWCLVGRADANFGSIAERWEFLIQYLSSERLAYAFIWDIWLYTVFQPWLIGENLQNIKEGKVGLVNYLRFVPVVGLVAYLIFLELDEE